MNNSKMCFSGSFKNYSGNLEIAYTVGQLFAG
jgi:hypothetical protein